MSARAISPSIWHPFFSEFAFFVESSLEKRNYKMFLCNSNNDAQKEKEYIQMVMQNKVDGIIGITYSDIDEYVSSKLPFVSIDRSFTEEVIYVTADNEAGGKLAVNELLKHGATHLAYIGGYQDTPNETKKRRKYFELEAKAKGCDFSILDMLEPITDLESKVTNFLLDNPQIDGIFTINDAMAIDVSKVLKKIGRKIPKDVQIIGFDGQRYGESQEYLVSSIAQPIQQMAEKSVELLIDMIQGKEVATRTILPVYFVESWSTKKKSEID